MNKKLLLLTVLFTLTSQSMLLSQPTFEIINKTKSTIWVALKQMTSLGGQETIVMQPTPVNPVGYEVKGKISDRIQKSIDTNKFTHVLIWKKEPKNISTLDDAKYEIINGKTIYVTFDDKGLRPQTGKWGGWKGETESGLSLKNNVSAGDIFKK